MRNTLVAAVPAALLAIAVPLLAGGFFLQVGNPEASPEARKLHAVLVVKAAGCHDPATARLTATAIGIVDGRRQSIPLTVTALSEPGSFALTQQWPSQGRWVIELVARNTDQFTNTLVAAGPEGVDHLHAKYDMKPFAAGDVEAMLHP